MAATAWSLYNTAKKYIMNGTIDLDTNTLKLKLHTSASNASTFTLSTFASINFLTVVGSADLDGEFVLPDGFLEDPAKYQYGDHSSSFLA